MMSPWSFRLDDDGPELGVGEEAHELASQILLGSQEASPGVRALSDHGRIRAQEGWSDRRKLASGRGEVHRDMVSLEAPGPGPILGGGTEDVEVVVLGIASIRPALDLAEDPSSCMTPVAFR